MSRSLFASTILVVVTASAAARAQDAGAPAPDDDVEVPSSPAPAPVSAPSPAPTPALSPVTELAQLRARIEALEARAAHEPPHPVVRDDPPHEPTTAFDASPWSRTPPRGFLIDGYVQGQYQQSQTSCDQLDANGGVLNQDRLVVRRARLRAQRGWEYASALIEIDGNNNNGIAFGVRRAEASVFYRASDPSRPPLAALTVGLSDIPFGYELVEPNRTRLFLERTTASRAFFPGESDFTARLSGAIGWFRYAVAVLDGTPVPDSEPASVGFDPTSEKDIMARLGVETTPLRGLDVSGGVSFVRGTGFHAGTAATKDSLQWRDINANGSVDTGELTGLPGAAATPSKTFGRWAVGVDLELRIRTPIGRGLATGEVYVGNNQDRGLFVADPVAAGTDIREVGFHVDYLQEITPYGVVGLRLDAYDPNADATTSRAGALLPLDQTITTWSPLVGLIWPGRARLLFEYDRVVDHQGLDSRGVPTDLRNDQWALRLQVDL